MTVGDLIEAMYPDVAPGWRELVLRYATWTFDADDALDRCRDAAASRACADDLRRGIAGVADAVAAASSRHHGSALAAHVDDFFDACAWEAANRDAARVPSFEEYRRMRPHTGAMWGFLRLALAASEVASSVEVAAPARRLFEQIVWLPCLANDLVSFDKELATGDVHNAVAICMHEHRESAVEARRAMAAVYQCERAAFDAELAASAGVFSAQQRAALQALVAGSERWLQGSARYALVVR